MNQEIRLSLRVALAAAVAAGCSHSHGGHVLSLHESEPNDHAFSANYLGVLRPGDQLVVHGAISDSGLDPFDGFAFTAGEPITVDFRLHAASSYADLDVCLFDPKLGITVDCFESPFDPEEGVVHVLAGGADFHLVVNAFTGSSAYALELDVHPLHLAYADSAPETAESSAMRGGTHAASEKTSRIEAFRRYAERPARGAHPAVLGAGRLFLFDAATGAIIDTAILVETSEGSLVWMGDPDEVDAGDRP